MVRDPGPHRGRDAERLVYVWCTRASDSPWSSAYRRADAVPRLLHRRLAVVLDARPEEAAQAVLQAARDHVHVQVRHALADAVVHGHERAVGAQPFLHRARETPQVMAFLDHRPVFHGHCLLVPRAHVETLDELPPALVEPLFREAQHLSRAVRAGLDAHGTFVAMNNRVSQSVPHLHVHVVPRRAKDGLRGFFWPRVKYESDAQLAEYAARIRAALAR